VRYGLVFVPEMAPARVVGIAQEAEALGFDTVYVPDQTFHRDPFALLAACAQATETIELGLGLTNPYTRHPVQVARAAGVLGELAEGRFLLGLGAGNRPRLLHGMGMEQTGLVVRLRESIDVIRRLLAGEVVDHDSPTLTLNEVALDYRPAFPVPVYVGTRGPRVLALAGEVADAVIIEGLFTPPALEWAIEQIDAGVAAAQRARPPIAAWQMVATGDAGIAATPLSRRWAALLISTTRADTLRTIGVSGEAIRCVAEEKARGAGELQGHGLAPEDVMKMLMVGPPDALRQRIEELEAGGVRDLVALFFGDEDAVRTSMRAFAKDVARLG
jgi:5,10-methylenetetrahydromethanopterin reductase